MLSIIITLDIGFVSGQTKEKNFLLSDTKFTVFRIQQQYWIAQATDICTLMLYEKFAKWKQHNVVSKNYLNIWNT